MKKYIFTAFITLFIITIGVSQNSRFQFPPNLNYNQNVPSPSGFLGYELGEEYTFHHKIVAYFNELAKASNRISVHSYGKTYEGRELIYAVITSEANHNRLDEIREANLSVSNGQSTAVPENQPVVVWLSYNVHGNEASSSEAAMQTAYHLAAAQDAETAQLMEHAVVIIDPMMNPDGRDRYVFWYKSSQARVLNTDSNDLEHDEIWPGGRSNHYWFDLNRDWVWLVHPESQGRIAAYQKWVPQVHLDLHEQGFNSNYFTMPGESPRNLQLPKEYDQFADKFGRGVIKEFDKHQINYFTREAFDFFYPGYGSSYPSIMGGIGMLAEQGGHSRGGRAVTTDDGYVLTLRQRLFDHYTNSIATVRTAVENRAGLLAYFKNAFSVSTKVGPEQAYILPDNSDDYTYDVINLMLKHGIKVQKLTQNTSINAFSYWDGKAKQRSFKAGDFVIPAAQARHLFVSTLFRRQLQIEDSVMYDMSTWSVPQAYNLDAAWIETALKAGTETVTTEFLNPSGLENADAQYAYVIDWNQRNAPKALVKLWNLGYNVRSAEQTFMFQGRTYSQGSIIVLKGRNVEKQSSMVDDMRKVADKAQVVIRGFDTGRMDAGMDLASRSSRPLKKPRVALMVDQPFSSLTAGQLWYLFDYWAELGISRIRTGSLSANVLSQYDVLVLPGSNGLMGALSSSIKDQIKAWVQAGGTIVGTEGAANFLTKNQSGITSVEIFNPEEGEKKKEDKISAAAFTRYEDRTDSSGLRRIPGASFKAQIDNSHPVAFGLPETLYSLTFSTRAFVPNEAFSVVGYYMKNPDDLLASGYSSQENLANAAGKAFAAHQRIGRGNAVLLLDNTQYRMFWLGPARLMLNSVLQMPSY